MLSYQKIESAKVGVAMGTTDKTAAIRQKRLRERRAKALAEYQALQDLIDELAENLQLSDAEKWQMLLKKIKGQ